jgi:hypothetical protein
MSLVKMIAVVLITLGVIGLVYGNITYTKESHETKVGPIELSIKDKETISIPIWAGVGSIAFGSMLLLLGRRKN